MKHKLPEEYRLLLKRWGYAGNPDDLEELLEWGIKKLKHKFPFWSLSGTHRGYCCKYGVETENGGCYYHQTTNDPDPKLALVKLLKQVLGD